MHRHPPLNEQFTGYATIALATIAIEHALETAAPEGGDVYRSVAALVADLWVWQAGTHLSGRKRMSENEARGLPAFAFCGRLATFRALRDQRVDAPRLYALLSGVCSLLELIVWIMDGIERDLNWGKPSVAGQDIGDEAWALLQDGLEALTRTARAPDDEFEWQARIVAAFGAVYPGGGSEEREAVSGSPVTRDEAHQLQLKGSRRGQGAVD